MHFNTGNEKTGKQITKMDTSWAKFLMEMALFQNTLATVFFCHGHKMTPFCHTEDGRREIFDPVLSMIVPDEVKEKLGPEKDWDLGNTPKAHLYVLRCSQNSHEFARFSEKGPQGLFSNRNIFRDSGKLYLCRLVRASLDRPL